MAEHVFKLMTLSGTMGEQGCVAYTARIAASASCAIYGNGVQTDPWGGWGTFYSGTGSDDITRASLSVVTPLLAALQTEATTAKAAVAAAEKRLVALTNMNGTPDKIAAAKERVATAKKVVEGKEKALADLKASDHVVNHAGAECRTSQGCDAEGAAPCDWCGGQNWFCCAATKPYVSSDRCAQAQFFEKLAIGYHCAKLGDSTVGCYTKD